ncbi:MAG: hypothetical protein NC084_02630 [Bacteroides sp.]|nr:hypothetical protein [Eubacterium sp.]MCM1417411.1 hypothetical protein [Roseburia sp.]MCM1461590.1 hypothetical protein [Bacteroides sp.]
MTDIFLFGDPGDDRLGGMIRRRLSKTYRITYIAEGRFLRLGKGYDLLFYDGNPREVEGAAGAVLILKEGAALPARLPDDCTAIVSADSEAQRAAVRERRLRTIACGVSATATVSFSSETDETIVVTLNRAITALSGKEIQPLELPVLKEGLDHDTLMRFTALRLLLDDFDSELGKLY